MKYKVSVVKKITLLLMTMALAVAMVACPAATPKTGDAGPAGPAGPPGKSGPTHIGAVFVDVSIGPMATTEIDLTEHFHDPDGKSGETLTYKYSSSDEAVATASVAGSTLTITAVAEGNATISVTAMDKDELTSPAKKFRVAVAPAMAPTVKAGGIGPQMLYLADGPMDIVLTTSEGSDAGYFTHSSAISYAVSVDPTGYVEASEANGTLTLKPLLDGRTRVTVVATADNVNTDPVTFTVEVKPGSKPVPTAVAPTVKAGGIGPQMLYLADGPMDIVLTTSEGSDAGYFTHSGAISYAVSSSPSGVVSAREANGTLTLTPLVTGPTRVTVVATADNMSTDPVIFAVTVMADSKPEPEPDPEPAMDPTIGEIGSQTLYWPEEKTVETSIDDPDGDNDELRVEVMSSNTDAATAAPTEDGDVKITSVFPGSADITVTVTDEDDMSTTLTFSVTVSKPMDLMLDVDQAVDFPVLAGYTVEPGDVRVVEVTGTSPNYKVKALKKGSTTLDIIKDNRTKMTVKATTNNRAPMLGTEAPLASSYELGALPTDTTEADRKKIKDVTGYADTEIYQVLVASDDSVPDLTSYFKDPDGTADKVLFNARSSRPSHAIVAGIKEDGSAIYIDLLDTVGDSDSSIKSFDIVVSAKDNDPDMPLYAADELVLTVDAVDDTAAAAVSFVYLVNQNVSGITGLKKPVGLRKDVVNTVRFTNGILVLKGTAAIEEVDDGQPEADFASANYLEIAVSSNIMLEIDDVEGSVTHTPIAGEVAAFTDIKFKTMRSGPAWIDITHHVNDGTDDVKGTKHRLGFTVATVMRKSDDKVIIK